MILGVVNAGKAKGATTVALGLGAAFAEHRQSVVIEADMAGGDVGYWRGLEVNTHGVLDAAASVSAATTVEEKADAMLSHAWTHPEAQLCSVLALGANGAVTENVLSTLWSSGRDVFAGSLTPFVFDFGRWGAKLTENMWAGVDAAVVVTQGSLGELKRLVAGANAAPIRNGVPTWIVVNGSPWEQADIARTTAVEVATVLNWDAKAAEAIRLGNWKKARRSLLGRQLREQASAISETVLGSVPQ